MDSDAPEIHAIWDEAKTHIEHGNYDKAIDIYKYILVRYSDNDIAVQYANAYLGDVYITIRQLDLAERHIKKAISFNPGDLAYHYLLGVIYGYEARWEKAIRKFRRVVAGDPANAEYLRGLGWALHHAGDKAQGLEYLHRALELAPASVNILNDLAAAYLFDYQFCRAREYVEQVLRIAPNNDLARKLRDGIDRFEADLGQSLQE